MTYVSELLTKPVPIWFKFIILAVAFVALYLLSEYVLAPTINQVLKKRDFKDHLRKPLMNLTRIMLVFASIGGALALAQFGRILQSLATIGAAGTLAIGFATQSIIKNFVCGIFIILEKPFRIGDWIEWEQHSGVVDDINLRVTRVLTFNNEMLTVPNSDLINNVVKNPVSEDTLRLTCEFGIGYDDDIGLATEIILEEAEKLDGIMEDPEPSVRLSELDESDVGLTSRFWIENPARSDFVKTRSAYVQNVKKRFDEEDVHIPYPQRELSGELDMTEPEPDADAD